MQTKAAPPASLPFDLGEARSFQGLTIVPLFAAAPPQVEYVGLDEASAGGLTVTEVSEAGSVESLFLTNPLADCVLLYEGEELVGAKQNRVLERSILAAAGAKLEIPAKCVEQGRWGYRSRRFAPAPRAAHPELRRLRHDLGAPSQGAVWGEVAAKSVRLGVHSPTGAADRSGSPSCREADARAGSYPRPTNGILVAITVMNCTLASSGRVAM